MTRVWVASDSTNQPERNSAAPAWKTHSMTPKVSEVEHRAERAEEDHEPADEADVPVRRAAQLLLVDVVGRDRQLAGVVEQVVEQDLARAASAGTDRNSDAPAAENMLPKLLEVPISTYLMVLAKIRRPSATPSASTSRSFSSRITSAASLATSVAGVDGDADVGGVQGEGVVDAVAEERDPAAGAALDSHDAGLVLRG